MHQKEKDRSKSRLCKRALKLRLHTAINRADFVSWWMWFNGTPTKVQGNFLTNAFCSVILLHSYLYNMHQDTKSARLIAVCKRTLSDLTIRLRVRVWNSYSSSLWLNCYFRDDVLCQRENDEFIVPHFLLFSTLVVLVVKSTLLWFSCTAAYFVHTFVLWNQKDIDTGSRFCSWRTCRC